MTTILLIQNHILRRDGSVPVVRTQWMETDVEKHMQDIARGSHYAKSPYIHIVAGFEYQVMPHQVTIRNRESASPKPLRKTNTCYDIQKFQKTDSSAAKQCKRQVPQRPGDQTTSPNTGSGISKIPDRIGEKHPLL